MNQRHSLFAIVATALLGLSVLSTGAFAATAVAEEDLTVEVTQSENVTVTVADNGTAVENASVSVTAVNNTSYAGEGEYTTDVNGTVALPDPEENATVTVEVAVDNATAATTVELTAADETDEADEPETFGQQVALFVHGLIATGDYDDGENETENETDVESDDEKKTIGQMISAFVTANNPGADERPDHAGPENKGPSNESDDDRRGPPEDKGPEKDDNDDRKGGGPPEDRGPTDDGDDADEDSEA